MSDERQPDERRMSDLFRQVEAPASMRRWDAPGDAVARRSRWWTRPLRALFVAGGERRLRPLAAALVLPVLVLAVGGGLQLRAHFSGGSGSAVNPPARSSAAMAFDAARGQVVMFGGRAADGQLLGDTWTWDGGSWTQQHPAVSPSPRSQSVMAFDAAHGVVLLYGGFAPGAGPDTSRQTWTWDGSNWHQMTTAHSPAATGEMAYDAKRNQVIFVGAASFGGGVVHAIPAPPAVAPAHPGTAPTPGLVIAPTPLIMKPVTTEVETWTWTGSDWKQLAPHTTPSGAPSLGSLAWDGASHRLTLLTSDNGRPMCGGGGEQVGTAIGEVQAQAGAAASAAAGAVTHGSAGWSGYAPIASPPPPSAMPLPSGTRIIPMPVPEPCMAIANNSLGSASSGLRCPGCPLAHQWTWDGSNWSETRLGSNVSFGGETLVTDPSGGRPLAVDSTHTWTWNGSKWVAHEDPTGLQQRHSMSLAADTAHNVVVLFGGLAGAAAAGDTWTWDGKAWTHVAGPVPQPQDGLPEPGIAIPGVNGAPSTPHIVCTGPQIITSEDGSGGLQIVLNRQPASCFSPSDATITLLDAAGRTLPVRGNGVNVGTQAYVLLRWTNWCGAQGGSVQMHEANVTTTNVLHVFPTCTDRSQPSMLTRTFTTP